MILPLLGLGAAAAFLYLRFGARDDSSRSSGSVTLHPGVPYGFEAFWPKQGDGGVLDLRTTAERNAVVDQLSQHGMLAPSLLETPTGFLIHYGFTPAVATPMVLGSTVFGPAVLRRVYRRDGKAWDTP